MNGNKDNNGGNGLRPIFLALYFLGVVLSGGGGTYVWLRSTAPEVVRPDPFTGTEARRIRTDLERHLTNHPDAINRFDARLTALEARQALIIQNQERILNRLDRMNGK